MGYSASRSRLWAVTVLALLISLCPAAQADIYQWLASPTYGVGSDHAAWYLPSTTLCPGGLGKNAVPRATLDYRNLTQAYLVGADLSGAVLWSANLTNAAMANANLSHADVHDATLTNADLANANLSSASFYAANVTGVNFAGATIAGASLNSARGFTKEQLYSTASYASGDLSGIDLGSTISGDLFQWNFVGKNLSNAKFAGKLITSSDFGNANLSLATFGSPFVSAKMIWYTNFANANLTGADFWNAWMMAVDLRGAQGFSAPGATLSNTIMPDGKINGLTGTTVIRNHDTIPVSFQGSATTKTGTLQFVFDGHAWHQPATFGTGVVPAFASGTLEVWWSADPAFQLAEATRMELDLFQWGSVPAGSRAFGNVKLTGAPRNVILDASHLYTDGSAWLVACHDGDGNGDGMVDVGDLGILGANYGKTTGMTWATADFTGDGAVDVGDLGVLGANYGYAAPVGSVPEPATLSLLAVGGLMLAWRRR